MGEWEKVDMREEEFYGPYVELRPPGAEPLDDRTINIFGGTEEQLEAMRKAISELDK